MRNGFQEAKLQMLSDALGKRTLAALDAPAISAVAHAIATDDCYRERQFLARALRLTGAAETDVYAVIEHQLWCAWRQARWATGRISAEELASSLKVEGGEWLAETDGKPTILIAPMTLCTWDAVEAVLHIARHGCAPREIIFYGEEMGGRRAQFVSGEDLSVLRRIARVLANGGMFCTYADFVYRGHAVLPVRMFGEARSMSAGFAHLLAQPDVYLLPCLLSRHGERIKAEISEPVVLENASESDGSSFQTLAAQVVADILVELIRRAPEQWLLLPTLSFEAPEMAPRSPVKVHANGSE